MEEAKIIPEKYWNKLYDWEGGGYDGCLWEFNQGVVDGEGHWRPIYSTGADGLDQDDWYERKIADLKDDLGYDVRDADVQHHEKLVDAVRKVFGEKWYMVEGHSFEDPRVLEIMKDEERRYREFRERRDAFREERAHRLDAMFMEVVNGELERYRFDEVGSVDKEHAKETCRRFCDGYRSNVGMMVRVLDWLASHGYEAWCTCSDCGEQFQLGDYESFSCSMDENAYTGDGGIGVVLRRILCDECHEQTECRACGELNRPNRNAYDEGESAWSDYDFLSCLLLDWLDVCWSCSNHYEYTKLKKWDEERGRRVNTEIGEQYYELEEKLEEKYDETGRELYDKMKESGEGRLEINEIRELLEDSVKSHFKSYLSGDWFLDRLEV